MECWLSHTELAATALQVYRTFVLLFIYLFSSIVDPSLWHTSVSAWTRSKQAGGEQSCTIEDFLVTISIGYSVCSKSLINMFQGI